MIYTEECGVLITILTMRATVSTKEKPTLVHFVENHRGEMRCVKANATYICISTLANIFRSQYVPNEPKGNCHDLQRKAAYDIHSGGRYLD
jgi:hypothetical protein